MEPGEEKTGMVSGRSADAWANLIGCRLWWRGVSTSRENAEMLAISLKTVLGHRAKIIGKLDIHNHTELIKCAIRKGLVSMDI